MSPRQPDQPPDRAIEGEVLGAGGRRSEATRRTILKVARQRFATRGYEQTTIRAVAAQAGIDPSMVMRYFGSKAGLFAAASTIHLQVPDLRSVPHAERGEVMVRHFVERWEHSPGDDTLVFLLRTAVTNDGVADQLQAQFQNLITGPIAELGVDQPERRASLIGTQLLGLALCRYVLRFQPIASAAADDVINDIAPTVQFHLETSGKQHTTISRR
jgi:AcrR family transcriptional regulator